MSRPSEPPLAEGRSIQYVSGIDIGSQSCLGCICSLDKRVVVKPMEFANTKAGWKVFVEKLEHLGVPPSSILVGMEATARSGENLSPEWEQRGYALWRLASRANPPVSPATRIAGQNGPARCHDHCTRALEWGSSPRLHSKPTWWRRIGNWSACTVT